MRFLIIIFCLLSEKYLTHQFFTFRKKWSDVYAQLIEKHVPINILNANPWMRYSIYLGFLTLLCVIFGLFGHHGIGLVINFFFELSVFYICLGEHNLFYVNANEKKLLDDNQFIIAMNQEFYAIILWFYILGPFGALFYRVTLYFNQQAHTLPLLVKIKAFLDWLPVRLSALLFLLIGDFQPGFTELCKKFLQNPLENNELLIQTARHALSVKEQENINMMKLQNLFNHSCLILLFLLAIFVIGHVI